MLAEAQQVAAIPVKRTSPPQTLYLEHDEINAIFSNLSSIGSLALRDHALLLFLYNTGARAQEVADLRVVHLKFVPSLALASMGKAINGDFAPCGKRLQCFNGYWNSSPLHLRLKVRSSLRITDDIH